MANFSRYGARCDEKYPGLTAVVTSCAEAGGSGDVWQGKTFKRVEGIVRGA